MPQLGKAYIEVHADLSAFPTELRAQLQKALKEGTAGLSFSEVEGEAEKAGERAADAIGDGMKKRSKTSSKKAGEQIAADVGLGVFGALRRLFSRSGNNGSQGLFKDLGTVFSEIGTGASDAAKQVQSFGEKVSSIGGKIGSAFSGIQSAATGLFYALLVPAISAGISLLVQLAGALLALPAAIALVAAAIAPLIIAFQGLGGAIAAGFSGDPKKFAEALRGLAPAARSVVKEIVGLKGAFDGIKNSVQQAFFGPLVGSFKALATTLIPALKVGLTEAAGALGRLAAGFVQILSDPKIVSTLTATFATLAAIIDDIAPVAVELFTSLFGLIKTGLPYVQKFADYLAVAAQSFVDFLDKANATGKIGQLIQDAAKPFGELIKLLAVVGDLFFTIFANPAVKDASNSFINSLIKAVGLLDQFFHSAEGQKVLVDFANTIKRSGLILIAFAGIIIGVLEALHYIEVGLKTAGKAVLEFFQAVGQGAVTAVKAIGSFFATVGNAIANFFTKTIPDAFHAVVSFFVSIGSAISDFFKKTIPNAFNAVVDFFKRLPNQAGDGLSSLGTKIKEAFEHALSLTLDTAARGLGRIIGIFLASPTLIRIGLDKLGTIIHDAFFSALHGAEDAVSTSLTAIGHFFTDTLPNAVESGLTATGNAIVSAFNATLDFFSFVGQKIGDFFVSIYHSIVDTMKAAVNDARDFVVDGFNAIVSFFYNLPGRIAALGPKLLHAAEDLGRQIGQGLKNIGNFASDIGKSILNDLKSGLNRIIGSINAGINDIGGSVGLKLPNLPKLAKGGVVDSPTVALIGERGPEVVVPLTDPARAAQIAQESGLAAMLARGAGAPVVNVTAILGTGQILDVIDQRVTHGFTQQGNELAYGARG